MPLDVDKMRQFRLAKGLTQEKAAESAGLSSRQAWQRIEDGTSANVTVSTLDSIAATLGVEPMELLVTKDVKARPKR